MRGWLRCEKVNKLEIKYLFGSIFRSGLSRKSGWAQSERGKYRGVSSCDMQLVGDQSSRETAKAATYCRPVNERIRCLTTIFRFHGFPFLFVL